MITIIQVDILKPNVTELVQMVSHALRAGQINSGRALVQNTLSTIAGDRIDQRGAQGMEISDVRVLLNALYQVMHTAPAAGGSGAAPAKSGFLGGLLRQEAPVASAAAASSASKSSNNRGDRAVASKHIIVSLGSRGVLWCDPAKQLTTPPSAASGISAAYLKDGSCVVNEATQSATIFVPAVAVNAADIVHTNGAGDALCAGLLAEIVRKRNAALEAKEAVPPLPDMECVQKGLLSAHHWLVSK